MKVLLHHFSKVKFKKKSQNSRNQGFSYYFCLMIEGSGSGSIPLTNGSGSGSRRPKNTWIQWTRIRIRIRNTATKRLSRNTLHLKDGGKRILYSCIHCSLATVTSCIDALCADSDKIPDAGTCTYIYSPSLCSFYYCYYQCRCVNCWRASCHQDRRMRHPPASSGTRTHSPAQRTGCSLHTKQFIILSK